MRKFRDNKAIHASSSPQPKRSCGEHPYLDDELRSHILGTGLTIQPSRNHPEHMS